MELEEYLAKCLINPSSQRKITNTVPLPEMVDIFLTKLQTEDLNKV